MTVISLCLIVSCRCQIFLTKIMKIPFSKLPAF